jgi:hypothetical protein
MSPQAVEVFQQGAWWPGSLLGWRHDSGGACEMWVRVEVGGISETAWVDLSTLRLPEAGGPLATRSALAAGEPRSVSPTAELSVRAAAEPGDRKPAATAADDLDRTQHLPLVREAETPRCNGERTHGGGRRRAPEFVENVRIMQSAPAAPPGRHRAPATGDMPALPGRHRSADTGVFAPARPVTADWAASAAVGDWTPPPPRSELPPAGPVVRARLAPPGDGDLLTRPMRLDEAIGSGRPERDRRSLLI